MNLIGKIFVVIIVVLSVLFMGLSMAVYSTHKNWYAAVQNQRQQLQDLQTELDRLKSQYQLVESNLQLEIDSAQQQIRKLESERVALVARNEDIQTAVNQLKQEQRDATQAVASTQANNAQLAQQNVELQQNIIAAQEAADRAFSTVVDKTSELHDTATKLNTELERNAQLTQQVADMTTVMREEGLDPATLPGDVVPRVDGYVSGIRRLAGAEAIELTIGSDDGLKRGHTLEIFRGDRYLGRAEVQQTGPDWAVARVISQFKVARIQEGDRVATRLN